MSKLRPEFKIGVLVVAGLVLLVLGVNYLKGFNPFAKTITYYAVYEDVAGLAVSNPVLINGYQIGQVRSIDFLEGGEGKLIVAFEVEEHGVSFPVNSVAKIHSSDLFGTKAIRIEKGDSPVVAQSGDTLVNGIEDDIAAQVAKQIEPLQRKTTDLIKSVEEVIDQIESVFNSEATDQLPEALESVQRTVNALERTAINLDSAVAENRHNFLRVMSNVRSLTSTLNENSDEFSNLITNLSSLSDTLSQVEFSSTMLKANQALDDISAITEGLAAGEGSLGQLLTNDSLHSSLIASNRELQLLLDDIQMHPWKYVQVNLIGRKPKSEFSNKDLERIQAIVEEELEALGTESQQED